MKSTSSESGLKETIKDKLSEKSLSVKQLNELHTLLNGVDKANPAASRRPWYMAIGLSVAMLVVFIVSSVPSQSIDMPQLIANEVVRNHLKLKPLDVSTSSFKEIRHYFDKLKFSPISSLNIPNESALIGGRYCSLQGYKAAQLRIKNIKSKKIDTLYQAPYVKGTFGDLPNIDNNEKPIVVYERGIKVSIWVEKGILFARTHVSDDK